MSNFWQGKRVCVLGGAGFLGSFVVEQLKASGAQSFILDNCERGLNMADPAFVCDVSNHKDLNYLLEDIHPDVVLNLAATVAGVLYNQTHNADMFASNMALQTVPVIVCDSLKIPRFIQVSSVCVYAPEYAEGALEENGQTGDPVAANNGYAWAKRMGERAALWSTLPSFSILRPSNMYGPRDYFDERAHVIPALIKKCLNDDVIQVHGTGEEVREFLYVEDAARGLLAAAKRGGHREVYNLGTHGWTKFSIAEVLDLIQGLTHTQDKQVVFTSGDAGDRTRWSNCQKAVRDLDFMASRTLLAGLRKTIDWYQRKAVAV